MLDRGNGGEYFKQLRFMMRTMPEVCCNGGRDVRRIFAEQCVQSAEPIAPRCRARQAICFVGLTETLKVEVERGVNCGEMILT